MLKFTFTILWYCFIRRIYYYLYCLQSDFYIFTCSIFFAICKVILFHILIVQLLLLCTVKPVNIGHGEDQISPDTS